MNERRDVLERASVLIEKERIAAIGTAERLRHSHPGTEVVDCTGRIVMPGMVSPYAPVPPSSKGWRRHGAEELDQLHDVPAAVRSGPGDMHVAGADRR